MSYHYPEDILVLEQKLIVLTIFIESQKREETAHKICKV